MIARTNNRRALGIRKAAILVASLDQAAADLLLEQLSPECADLVRQAVMDIEELDAEERQRVIDEFRRIGPMVPDPCPPGIELDSLPACPAGQPFLSAEDFPAAEQVEAPSSPKNPQPFGFLRETEERRLSELLAGERPQTIALVLSHLSPEQAGEALARFAPPLQVEVVRRLVDLESTDLETLREVEQALESRLSRQFAIERERTAGPETVARIFASCNSGVVGSIMNNLAAYDRLLAERLGFRTLDFDDLVEFDDAALLVVFQAVEPEVAEAALLGAPPRLVERLLRCMAPGDAKGLRRKLDCPGPIRLRDVEEARQQIAALAGRMLRDNPSKSAQAA